MKLSIIIPLFNIEEKLFRRCIESIINQHYDNWDCIIINDGSTNDVKYLEIIKKYNTNKFIYIEQKNQGLPISRNNGFNKSVGDLIWFVDPDDCIYDKNSFDKIVKIFNSNKKIDFLNFKYIEEFKKRNYINTRIKHIEGVIENKDNNFNIINLFDPFHSSWRNVYKKNFLVENNLLHQNKKVIFEDVFFDLILKSSAKYIYISNEVFYLYDRQRTDSICNKTNNLEKKIKIFVNNITEAYNWVIENNKNINLFYIHCLYYYSYFPFLNKKIIYDMNKFIKSRNIKLNWKQKISIFISKNKLIILLYRVVINIVFIIKKIINFFVKSYKII